MRRVSAANSGSARLNWNSGVPLRGGLGSAGPSSPKSLRRRSSDLFSISIPIESHRATGRNTPGLGSESAPVLPHSGWRSRHRRRSPAPSPQRDAVESSSFLFGEVLGNRPRLLRVRQSQPGQGRPRRRPATGMRSEGRVRGSPVRSSGLRGTGSGGAVTDSAVRTWTCPNDRSNFAFPDDTEVVTINIRGRFRSGQMADPDAALNILRQIIQDFAAFVAGGGTISEADTRANLIDKLLTQVCEWPERAITREETVASGRID